MGTGSGPGNVLNDRYWVERALPSKQWVIVDTAKKSGLSRRVTRAEAGAAQAPNDAPMYFPTMKAARAAAERLIPHVG